MTTDQEITQFPVWVSDQKYEFPLGKWSAPSLFTFAIEPPPYLNLRVGFVNFNVVSTSDSRLGIMAEIFYNKKVVGLLDLSTVRVVAYGLRIEPGESPFDPIVKCDKVRMEQLYNIDGSKKFTLGIPL